MGKSYRIACYSRDADLMKIRIGFGLAIHRCRDRRLSRNRTAALHGSPDRVRTGVSGLKGRYGTWSPQAVYLGKRTLTWRYATSVVSIRTHHYPLFLNLLRDR